jgi:CubicO group peptidase (beta-lactamase class C family)
MKHTLLAIILVSFIISCKTASPQLQSKQSVVIDQMAKKRIDSLFKKLVNDNNIGGISTLIYEDGKEVFYDAVGFQNKEKNIPMARNTIVQIWSMTKPIVGAALMTLYDQGKFQLDDPLSKYFPEFKDMQVCTGVDAEGKLKLEPAKRQITVRDITRHTAGFVNNPRADGIGPLFRDANLLDRKTNLHTFIKKLSSLPLMFHPGEQWAYGSSVDVQAALVEKLSGMPFYDYLRESVLDPLKMYDTRYFVPEKDRNRLSVVYNRAKEGDLSQRPDSVGINTVINDLPLKPGGYGLTSTLDDYMKFAQMLINKGAADGKRILKPETVTLMSTNQLDASVIKRMWLPDRGQVGFGIDFAVRIAPPATAEENNGVVGEFFWDGAASTLFWVDPKNNLTAVMLVQLFPYDQIKLHNRFRDAVYGNFTP